MSRTLAGLSVVLTVLIVGLGIGLAQKPAVVSPPAAPSAEPSPAAGPAAPAPTFPRPISPASAPETAATQPANTSGAAAADLALESVTEERIIRGADGSAAKVPITFFQPRSAPVDPEMRKLSEEVRKGQTEERSLLAKYAATRNEQERSQFKESLSKVLDKQFDLQQQARKRELEPIEARVKRLRELIEKRSQARKMIVEKRLDQLLRDAEGMGWTPPGEPAATIAGLGTEYPSTNLQGEKAAEVAQLGQGDANFVAPLGVGASISRVPGEPAAAVARFGARDSASSVPGMRQSGEAADYRRSAAAPSTDLPNYRPTAFAVPSDDASVLAAPASGQIEISLGANRGTIHKGERLAVYRTGPGGATHVGYVEVVEVKPDRSVCKIIPETQRETIQKGDRVATTQFIVPTTDATRQTQIKVFSLVNGDASAYAEVLSVLPAVRQRTVQMTVDKRTNCLVAAGPREDLLVVEALLLRLDARKTPKSKAEDGKKAQP